MDVEDDQFLNMFKGKRVKLTLKTSSYLGVIQRINTNKTLVLANGETKKCELVLIISVFPNMADSWFFLFQWLTAVMAVKSLDQKCSSATRFWMVRSRVGLIVFNVIYLLLFL